MSGKTEWMCAKGVKKEVCLVKDGRLGSGAGFGGDY